MKRTQTKMGFHLSTLELVVLHGFRSFLDSVKNQLKSNSSPLAAAPSDKAPAPELRRERRRKWRPQRQRNGRWSLRLLIKLMPAPDVLSQVSFLLWREYFVSVDRGPCSLSSLLHQLTALHCRGIVHVAAPLGHDATAARGSGNRFGWKSLLLLRKFNSSPKGSLL